MSIDLLPAVLNATEQFPPKIFRQCDFLCTDANSQVARSISSKRGLAPHTAGSSSLGESRAGRLALCRVLDISLRHLGKQRLWIVCHTAAINGLQLAQFTYIADGIAVDDQQI